jgi:hypothetical protein
MKKNTLATFIVAALISTASTSFAGDFIITDITDATVDQQIADNNVNGIRMGQVDASIDTRFGAVNPIVTDDIADGMKQLVQAVSPASKVMVFRDVETYDPLSTTALEVAATTPERIDKTVKFGVQNALNDAGLHITPEQYLAAVGIKLTNSDDSLLTEAEVIGKTYEHMLPRLQSGGDLFEVTSGKYAMNQELA